jgi:hypothetical protein
MLVVTLSIEGISELYRALEKPDIVGRSPLLPIQLFDTLSQLVNMVGPVC